MARKPQAGGSVKGKAGKAAIGLAAAAAAAYGAFLLTPPRRRRPATELGYALNLRLHYSAWRGLHYAYYSRAGSGRPVVFLHSINAVASAHEMRPLVQRFQRETSRPIYALEWLGFGHSDRPEISYTPALLEDQLEHFLARVVRTSEGADVIGLSLGATYAAELARRRPDLVHSLVAIEPAGLGDEPEEIGQAWARVLFTIPGVQRAFYDRLTTPDALYRFARENLFAQDFGVPEEYVQYGAETARVEGAARPLDVVVCGLGYVGATMAACLRRHGLPTRPADLGLTEPQFAEAIAYAPRTRPGRFTILEHLDLSVPQLRERVADYGGALDHL